MPGLIQVPSTKEEMQQFLADGIDTSIPAVQGSDINDGDILRDTRTVDLGNGLYKFAINLPSGRPLESAPIGADYSRTDAAMQWVEAVRGSIVSDAADAARATRDAHIAEARARDLAEPVQESNPRAPSTGMVYGSGTSTSGGISADPVEYAKQQLRGALERLATLRDAERDVERWQRVVDSLGGGYSSGGSKQPVKKKRKKKRGSKLATNAAGTT